MDLKSLGWKFLTKETFGDGKLTITKQRKKKTKHNFSVHKFKLQFECHY